MQKKDTLNWVNAMPHGALTSLATAPPRQMPAQPYFPPLRAVTQEEEEQYKHYAPNRDTRRLLDWHKQRFVLMHVAHDKWARYVGREFATGDLYGMLRM